MSDIRKLLDIISESSAGASTAGAVASVPSRIGETQKRVEDEKAPEISKVIEYGNWENSALTTSSKLKKERKKAAKVVKSIYGEDVQSEAANLKQQAAIAIAKKKDIKEGVAEGYILKKTNVNKYVEPGDPEDYTDDMKVKDTDYEIINNKTGQVVGTASWTTNDYFGPGALKITMKNGATRWLDIWEREKGNPQSAFNRFVKDPKTAKKYKEQGVAEDQDIKPGDQVVVTHPNTRHVFHNKTVNVDHKNPDGTYRVTTNWNEIGYDVPASAIKKVQKQTKLKFEQQGVPEGSKIAVDRKTGKVYEPEKEFDKLLKQHQPQFQGMAAIEKAQRTAKKSEPKKQGVAEGLVKDIKRFATGKDVKSRMGQEIDKATDATSKGDSKTALKHFSRFDKLDKLANKNNQENTLEESDLIIDPASLSKLSRGLISHAQDRTDHEVEMAKSDLYQSGKNAVKVYELIKDRNEEQGLEGWVQEKIIKANDYLNTVREYLEGKEVDENKIYWDSDRPAEPWNSIDKIIGDKSMPESNDGVGQGVHMFLEGISQEDLADVLCNRLERKNPDIYKKYDYDSVYRAIDDVASFHAGAEELGTSDINLMIRDVLKTLEESSVNEGKPGLWDNIRKRQASGKKARKPGSKGAPSAESWRSIKALDEQGVAEGRDNPLQDIDPHGWHLIRGDVPVVINLPDEYTAKSFHSGHGYGRETKVLHGSQVRQNAYLKHNPNVINYPEYTKGVAEGVCTECGGPAFSEESIAEAKDACYNKVKSRYKVWPSAYASGALVKCRKVGAKNWGNKGKK